MNPYVKMDALIKAVELASDHYGIESEELDTLYDMKENYVYVDYEDEKKFFDKFYDTFTEAVYWSKHG